MDDIWKNFSKDRNQIIMLLFVLVMKSIAAYVCKFTSKA